MTGRSSRHRRRSVTIRIGREKITLGCAEAHMLETLGGPLSEGGSIRDAVAHLIYSAIDGMRRPGSWERGWLVQAFGSDFEDRLEADPDLPWRNRGVQP